MEGKDGFDQDMCRCAAAEFAQEASGPQGGHGLLAEREDAGVGDVDGALPLGQLSQRAWKGTRTWPPAPRQVLSAQQCTSASAGAAMMPRVRTALMSLIAPGRAGEASSCRPNGLAMTCTFIPQFLCFPE